MSDPFSHASGLDEALDHASHEGRQDWERRFSDAFPPPPPKPAVNPGPCKVCGDDPETIKVLGVGVIRYVRTCGCRKDGQ